MGLGKTFTGAEKMVQLAADINLVICQKSKVNDWIDHFTEVYGFNEVYDLTKKKDFDHFLINIGRYSMIAVINYELAFRRKELLQLKNFTLMLDESSMIQNETAKRTKFIMKLNFKNLILLSGTPTSGKYENLISQINLLGWPISKDLFWKHYVDYHYDDDEGFPIKIVDGYKNVERLKYKLRQYGCRFLKTEEVFDLPKQIFNNVIVNTTKEYRKFKKDSIVIFDDAELVGDTTLTKMLYERQLCGQYNKDKLNAFEDLLQSSDDRIIVFYNFTEELAKMLKICDELGKYASVVNGKMKCLEQYENNASSVTFIQYQAGAMGLNLQKANKIIYFTPPLSSELFEQSKKRIHRIGQNSTCFYYMLVCKGSIEEKIYRILSMRKDYTDKLFEKGE